MLNHLSEEQLVLYYYSEGDGAPEIRQHLDGCETCRAEYGHLQRVLNVVGAAPVPERAADYGSQVWKRLQPSLGRRPRFILPWLWPARTWAAVAGVAVLVAAAFFAGRYSPRATQSSPQASNQPVRERILLVAMGDHLERSQMVLVELMNAPPGRPLDVTAERQRAGDLVAENRLYRQTALHSGDAGLARVLDDLEPMLLAIARGPSRLTPEELEKLRQRIEADGILFKVRIVGSTVRQREEQAAPHAAQNTL